MVQTMEQEPTNNSRILGAQKRVWR